VREQIEAVMGDLGADVWKLGMLGAAAHVRAVTEAWYAVGHGVPLVLDPVMVAKSGDRLLHENAVNALRSRLLPMALIVTTRDH
ncbi:MAG TPA: bifunctional hydroxymethylpyrimidine kinase/phosphomethylpyrimidine kinase, partial [Flavobacteriales bacterium]|nr:bifunctional hydroxymethylpyrimidine kinase/phosphomethylpyrimidine kinase [Flavobacteriales bacterium]